MRFADLHLHSRFSDGTYTPGRTGGTRRRCELAAIALTDHDSVEGCPGTARACAAAGIEFVVGAELTAEQDGNELHILGYCFDTQNAKFLAQIAKFQEVRQNRIREMVARLNQLGCRCRPRRCLRWRTASAPGAAARGARVGGGGPLRQPGRGLRAIPQAQPPGVGAQVQDVGGRGHCPGSPGRRGGGAGPSGAEPDRYGDPRHGRVRTGRHRVLSREAFHVNQPSTIWRWPTNIICW